MKTTKDILSAVIEDARYYLKRNVPDMRLDPKIVLDLAMDAERCAILEARMAELEKMVDARTPLAVNAIGHEKEIARLKSALQAVREKIDPRILAIHDMWEDDR